MAAQPILLPVIALAAWTMVMWAWLYATRIPAMKKAGMLGGDTSCMTARTLDEGLPPHVQWKAHNYNHLHEAPTVFYVIALVLAVLGHGDGINALLAWAYLGLRVAHSLVQATVNAVTLRWAIFMASSLVLVALIVRAGLAVI